MTSTTSFPPRTFNVCAEAILVRAHHAAPLPPGARLWVNEQGRVMGAISMGCVDQDVVERLQSVVAAGEGAQRVSYSEGNELTGEVGLTCGGRIEILLRRVVADDPVMRLLAEMNSAASWSLVTVLDGDAAGRQRLVCDNQPPVGSLGRLALDQAADRLIASACRAGAHVFEVDGMALLLERQESPPNLMVVGASAIAVHLCAMASRAGFRVVVADPRSELAQPERFGDTARIEHRWPTEAFVRMEVDASWYIAVLAHDLKLDTPALAEALRRECRYIGLLGSAKTQQKHRDRLRELGFDAQALARVRGPIGLALEAVTPEEIAVSIVAELILVRRGG